VPSVCRRIVVLLVVACLGVGAGPVVAAHAQGAGDQQYQDPFGDSGSGDSGDSGSSGNSDNNSSADPEPLTPAPQTSGSSGSGSSGSGSSGTTSSSSATSTTAPAATLPNTGLDTRVLLIGGAVLVLLGVGLRLRNAPERF
jgi:LPXTG-motif cell wall-anchored protein